MHLPHVTRHYALPQHDSALLLRQGAECVASLSTLFAAHETTAKGRFMTQMVNYYETFQFLHACGTYIDTLCETHHVNMRRTHETDDDIVETAIGRNSTCEKLIKCSSLSLSDTSRGDSLGKDWDCHFLIAIRGWSTCLMELRRIKQIDCSRNSIYFNGKFDEREILETREI